MQNVICKLFQVNLPCILIRQNYEVGVTGLIYSAVKVALAVKFVILTFT